jgi:HAD superfamily hydrolase (TIGR01509 family)
MTRPALFIDDGGVMNENARRARQWQRLVGQYFAARLGGASQAWAAANADVVNRLFADYEAHFDADPGTSFLKYWASYQQAWLSGMCTAVGVALPADRSAWSDLCRECESFVTRRVRAAYPGVVQVIRKLHAAGYVLRTASGERSWELEGYLAGMGVRSCFVDLYGVDLVDTAKASRLFYERIFSHAGVAPDAALVVDDSERALDWAADLGARTVLCRAEPPTNSRHLHVRQLADLSRVL